jgi:hypothetical protein
MLFVLRLMRPSSLVFSSAFSGFPGFCSLFAAAFLFA